MKKEACVTRTYIGGQALIEGVMMKGKRGYAVALRMPDGHIRVTTHPLKSVRDQYKFLGWPVIRGVVNFIEMLALGMKTITYSSDALGLEEEEPSKFELWLEKKLGAKATSLVTFTGIALGLLLAVGLFIFLPAAAVKGICALLSWQPVAWLRNLMEGLIKIGIFVGYVAAVSAMKDIRRTFEYHGAEHKSIHCFENGLPLTPENAQTFRVMHPRCGTNFMFIVMLVGILVTSVLQISWGSLLVRSLLKMLILPLIMGISYELLRLAGRYDNALTRLFSLPGMLMQRLTARTPDQAQLEVGIAALNACLELENGAPFRPVEEPAEQSGEEAAHE
ncbi:MAG: DUF1385 domain-containing protein [Clostridia bacterium]|nr:DUF1385 domain-containing protein [Clostridia bacterium]